MVIRSFPSCLFAVSLRVPLSTFRIVLVFIVAHLHVNLRFSRLEGHVRRFRDGGRRLRRRRSR
jgi:hypothetical protein